MTAEQWPLDTYTLPPVSPGATSLRGTRRGGIGRNGGGVYPSPFDHQGEW